MKKLIVLLLLFSYATLSEGFVSERSYMLNISDNLCSKLHCNQPLPMKPLKLIAVKKDTLYNSLH